MGADWPRAASPTASRSTGVPRRTAAAMPSGKNERGHGQEHGGRQPLHDQPHGRLLVLERRAEVPAEELLHEPEVLDVERLVEPERPRERLHLLAGGVGRQQHHDRVSGHVEDHEDEGEDAGRDDDRVSELGDQVLTHGARAGRPEGDERAGAPVAGAGASEGRCRTR